MRLLLLCLAAACTEPKKPEPPTVVSKHDKVTRAEFNRIAAELALPLFWREDPNSNGSLDPDELAVLWGVDESKPSDWQGARFEEAYAQIEKRAKTGPETKGIAPEELKRRDLLIEELSQGRQSLVSTDLRSEPEATRNFVKHILTAARHIERLYGTQAGITQMKSMPLSSEARMVLYRNQSPQCTAPRTQANPDCNALPSVKHAWGLYPAAMQSNPDFCAVLQKHADSKKLLDPFVIVTQEGDKLSAVPYPQAYAEDMKAVSEALKAAAYALSDTDEAALRTYLNAAAQSFIDNNWVPSDEAWAAMNATNSKWYLRVAPDEVYAEPCSQKALFHLTFARINQDSLKWQAQLDPVKNDMERALATLAGPPYKARQVSFHLPDFIEIVLNAGDDRDPTGGTIGQSLPNFGPVANQGRGRTVAMTNYDSNPDISQDRKEIGAALLTDVTDLVPSPEPLLRSVVLHEAAHNLGPAHQYRVAGKTDHDVFGGTLASMLEELKAQTAALFFIDWMHSQKMITEEQCRQSHVVDIDWMFGHIARGMYDERKHARPYSQLSAIQLGDLIAQGALKWDPAAPAANGKDKGALSVDHKKLTPAIENLMKRVGAIKAKGDKAAAEKLMKDYVDVDGEKKALLDTIAERVRRRPRPSYVYEIRLPN